MFQEFPGSIDRNTPETQLLGTPVSAKYVRILPLDYNDQVGLRFDVLGCTPDCKQTVSVVYRDSNYPVFTRDTTRARVCSVHRRGHLQRQAQLQLR